jgi:hypothetical protein
VISSKAKVAIIKLFPPGGQCETFVGVRIKSSLPFIFMDGAEV